MHVKNKPGVELWRIPSGTRWIWADDERPNQFVAALGEIEIPQKCSAAKIAVFADTKYKLYVNGRFVNAGPAPFWKPALMIDEYDLAGFIKPGVNYILVLACFVGADTKYNMKEHAGIIASFEARCGGGKISSATGPEWKVADLKCWHPDTPRRNWAIEQMEDLDLAHPDFRILAKFAEEDYRSDAVAKIAKNAWRSPRCFDRPDLEIRRRMLPPLGWDVEDLKIPRTVFRGNTEIYNWQDTAVRLDHEHAWPEFDEARYEQTRNGFMSFDRRLGEPGFLLLYDFGRMMAGDPAAEIHVERPCTLEFAMAEDLRPDGRPIVWRNSGHYYARYHLVPGLNRIRFYHFNGYRFLFLVFKDAVGKVEVSRVTSHSCRADLEFSDEFSSNDRVAESIYRISRRSIMLNTQACTYDCNTREQGTYWGDGVWIAESVGHMTGDFSHMRHLCLAANDEIGKSGPLLNASLFGMAVPLFDYSLVPVIALGRYHRFTGDADTAAACISTSRAIVAQFREYRDENGMITVDKMRQVHGDGLKGLLFLDHQGNGWHPMTTVGLDRRDVNSGFNLYYLEALQSLSALEKTLGGDSRGLDREISSLLKKCREFFFVPSAGLLADAAGKGGEPRFSQISNALAIMTGVLSGDAAVYALKKILDITRHPWISMGTPYSYFFLAEAAAKCQTAAADAVGHFNEAFRGHLERGATTTWESWRAENHDSRNHAWSAVMPHLVRRAVVGIHADEPGYGRILVRPAFDCFDTLDFKCMVPGGQISVSWRRTGADKFHLSASCPESSRMNIGSGGKIVRTTRSSWSGEIS